MILCDLNGFKKDESKSINAGNARGPRGWILKGRPIPPVENVVSSQTLVEGKDSSQLVSARDLHDRSFLHDPHHVLLGIVGQYG
jgi:hypothetical protein